MSDDGGGGFAPKPVGFIVLKIDTDYDLQEINNEHCSVIANNEYRIHAWICIYLVSKFFSLRQCS